MTKIIIIGAAGKMGGRIVANACQDREVKVVGGTEPTGSSAIGKDLGVLAGGSPLQALVVDDLRKIIAQGDAIIDFTVAAATLPVLEIAAQAKRAAVVGTTGHSEAEKQEIRKLSKKIPIVMAPNMSLGVNVMWKLISEAAKILGEDFPVAVTETHHIHKKDAPSGTALKMMEVLGEALGKMRDEIPCESLREGEEVGDHIATFTGAGEILTVRHQAKSRDTFALGAVRAAKWVVGKPAGLYDMFDVLGL